MNLKVQYAFKQVTDFAGLVSLSIELIAELTNLVNVASLIIWRPAKFQFHVNSMVFGTDRNLDVLTRLKKAIVDNIRYPQATLLCHATLPFLAILAL